MKQINTKIEWLFGFQAVIAAYGGIAASRMQKIRKKVLFSRDFLTGLNQVFQQVKTSYQKELERYKVSDSRKKNNKTAYVLLSANTGLYGDIIQSTFNLFLNDLKASSSDAVIVGQRGSFLFEEARIKKPFTYFEFSDTNTTQEEMKKIIDHLMAYEKVIVYHGLFKNILQQTVKISDVSGTSLLSEADKVEPKKIIFEPSLFQLAEFFESNVFSSLLMQTIFESQLAKFSSRMVLLDLAGENVKKSIKLAFWEKEKVKHKLINRKQLSLYTGMKFWKTR